MAAFLVAAAAPVQARVEVSVVSALASEHPMSRALARWIEAVNARPDGALRLTLTAGDHRVSGSRALDALVAGSVDAALVGWWTAATRVPAMHLPALPMFHGRPRAVVHDVLDGPVGEALGGSLEAALDVKVLGRWLDFGYGQLFFARRDIVDYGGLRDRRLLLPGGAAMLARYRALGVIPFEISWNDAVATLHSGVADGLMATYFSAGQRALAQSGAGIALEDSAVLFQYVPLMSGRIWSVLSAAQRKVLLEAWETEIDGMRAFTAAAESRAAQAFRESGGQVTVLPADAVRQARERGLTAQPTIVRALKIDAAIVAAAERRLAALAP